MLVHLLFCSVNYHFSYMYDTYVHKSVATEQLKPDFSILLALRTFPLWLRATHVGVLQHAKDSVYHHDTSIFLNFIPGPSSS